MPDLSPSSFVQLKSTTRRGLFTLAALVASAMAAAPAFAIGGDSDGWITATPGHPLGIVYQMRNSSHDLYTDGQVESSDAQFVSDVTLLRYVYPVALPGDVVWTPNVIIPYVDLRAGGDVANLGDTQGIGDLMLVSGFWPIHEGRTHLAIVPYLWLPTGQYHKGSALNAGENRYKTALQLGGQFPLGGTPLDFAGSIDTTFYGENKATDTKQAPLTEIDGWLKYNLPSSMFSHVAIGIVHVSGGENKVSGVSQDDTTRTTTLKLQFGTLTDDSKTNHVLFTLARDLKVENGFKVDNHVEMRFLHVF